MRGDELFIGGNLRKVDWMSIRQVDVANDSIVEVVGSVGHAVTLASGTIMLNPAVPIPVARRRDRRVGAGRAGDRHRVRLKAGIRARGRGRALGPLWSRFAWWQPHVH